MYPRDQRISYEKKHPSKNRNKLAISIGYLGVYEQLSQKRGSLKSTKFPFRYLRCILLFKSYPILNCALGGERLVKKHSIRLALFASPIGLVNRMILCKSLCAKSSSCGSPCWKKQRIDNNRKRIKKTRCVHDTE